MSGRDFRALAVVAWLVGGLFLVVPAFAQQRARHRDGRSECEQPREQPCPEEAHRDRSLQIEHRFGFPDPNRPWGRPRYLDPYRHRPRGYARRFGRLRAYYHDNYTYRFGVPYYGDPYGYDLERAYRQGLADGRNFERFEVQAERGLATYQQAMATGHAAFAAGDYGLAVRQFLLAVTTNQGDPTSRLCAAHAHVALGDYQPAARLLKRAIELQPKLIYLPMDIRNAYGNRTDFLKHIEALRDAVDSDADNGDLWFVLGYCYFFSNNMTKAAESLASAAGLRTDDKIVVRLADLARVSAQRSEKAPTERKSLRRRHDL